MIYNLLKLITNVMITNQINKINYNGTKVIFANKNGNDIFLLYYFCRLPVN